MASRKRSRPDNELRKTVGVALVEREKGGAGYSFDDLFSELEAPPPEPPMKVARLAKASAITSGFISPKPPEAEPVTPIQSPQLETSKKAAKPSSSSSLGSQLFRDEDNFMELSECLKRADDGSSSASQSQASQASHTVFVKAPILPTSQQPDFPPGFFPDNLGRNALLMGLGITLVHRTDLTGELLRWLFSAATSEPDEQLALEASSILLSIIQKQGLAALSWCPSIADFRQLLKSYGACFPAETEASSSAESGPLSNGRDFPYSHFTITLGLLSALAAIPSWCPSVHDRNSLAVDLVLCATDKFFSDPHDKCMAAVLFARRALSESVLALIETPSDSTWTEENGAEDLSLSLVREGWPTLDLVEAMPQSRPRCTAARVKASWKVFTAVVGSSVPIPTTEHLLGGLRNLTEIRSINAKQLVSTLMVVLFESSDEREVKYRGELRSQMQRIKPHLKGPIEKEEIERFAQVLLTLMPKMLLSKPQEQPKITRFYS